MGNFQDTIRHALQELDQQRSLRYAKADYYVHTVRKNSEIGKISFMLDWDGFERGQHKTKKGTTPIYLFPWQNPQAEKLTENPGLADWQDLHRYKRIGLYSMQFEKVVDGIHKAGFNPATVGLQVEVHGLNSTHNTKQQYCTIQAVHVNQKPSK